jgi:hypothetical protein
MTEDELQHMKQAVHELCGAVLRLQIDLMGKPDLRDEFAMAALPVFLTYEIDAKTIAEYCYAQADAMMESRK